MRSVFGWGVVTVLALAGCGGKAAGPCGEAECKAVCAQAGAGGSGGTAKAPASGGGLSAFEHQIVDPMIEDLRQGIRPFSDKSVGLCKGQGKDCEEFLGTTVDELPAGKYMLRAELRAPKLGGAGTWKVRLDTSCETTKKTKTGESKTTSTNSKELEVQYLGEDRGYRLSPLVTIESPSTGGARACTWKLAMLHPDGEKVLEGRWATPDADAGK